jgi:hypothetical protein
MNFKQYLAESEKTYKFRIKTVATVDKEMLRKIEQYLSKFNLIKVFPTTKTILQKHPLDFSPNIKDMEVYIVDVEMGLPVSSFIMEKELTSLLGLSGGYLLVRGEHDALETQIDATQQAQDIADQAAKKGLGASTLLSTESVYPDADQTAQGTNYYGNEYNGRFLKYLKDESATRKEKQKVEAPAPLFSWLDYEKLDHTPDDDQEFNKDLEKFGLKAADKDAMVPGDTGAFTDAGKVMKKTYQDEKGKTKTLKGKSTNVGLK